MNLTNTAEKTVLQEVHSQKPGFSVPLLHISIKTNKNRIKTTHINKTPHICRDTKPSVIPSEVEGKPANKGLGLATTVVQDVFVYSPQMFRKNGKVQGLVHLLELGWMVVLIFRGRISCWYFSCLSKMVKPEE